MATLAGCGRPGRARAGSACGATLAIGALSIAVVGCGGGGGGGGWAPSTAAGVTSQAPAGAAPVGSSQGGVARFGSATWPHLAAAREVTHGRFATALNCAGCHATDSRSTALQDAAGRAVGPFDLWQATLMANAARDPLWRAQVSVEIQATPALRAAIEDKCMRCHAPMAADHAASLGQPLSLDLLARDTPEAQLALDGVSCTLCHQQDTAPALAPSTFEGNWRLTPNRDLLGPYDQPFTSPMVVRTGYLPRKGDHVRASAQCASCHTLHTDAVDANGVPTGGRLTEQAPYLEWQNSAYNDEVARPGPLAASCASCHLPQRDADGRAIRTRIAHANGGQDFPQVVEREPFGRHVLVGGNTLVLSILRDQAADLRPLAPRAAFDETIAATRRFLQEQTATLEVGAAARAGDRLRVPVVVRSRAGHKFPTGHPTRRAWLRVRVRDAAGNLRLASGEHDAEGRIVGASGQPLASERAQGPTVPHRDALRSGDDVQVWEAVMADASGQATYLLLRGERYLKDDRLLPLGWSPAHPTAAETGPVGTGGDADFGPGGDTVWLELDLPAAEGPFTVEAALLYQPLSARYAAELFARRTPEVEAFESYYQAADRRPEQVATATAQVR